MPGMQRVIWIGALIGYAGGTVAMWFYFRGSGWRRTRGEFNLARGIGNDAIDALCEQIRKDTLKGMNDLKL